MITYIIRRILLSIPVWFGVMLITFILFNTTRNPRDLAQNALNKNASEERILDWIHQKGYGLPLFFETDSYLEEYEPLFEKYPEYYNNRKWYQTQFFATMSQFIRFDLGKSDKTERKISTLLSERIGPSLWIQIPAYILGLFLSISFALFIAMYRGTTIDIGMVFVAVLLMSIPYLAYLIGASFLNGKYLFLFPNYGTIALPIFISVIAGLGGSIRFYRTIFLDQINADYVKTARAKGLSEWQAMYKHVLPNSLVPILTSAVMSIPFLITGALLLETFFGIPGMGDLFLTAIASSDFAVIKAYVYLGAVLYMVGLLLTDISYAIVDPRITLK